MDTTSRLDALIALLAMMPPGSMLVNVGRSKHVVKAGANHF